MSNNNYNGEDRNGQLRTSTSDVRVVREISTTEPVTLAEAKNYLRIQNDADDALITSVITNARRHAERFLNSDIVPKQREVYYTTVDEDINLYYAPITSVTSVAAEGETLVLDESYEVLGLANPVIRILSGGVDKITISYTTAGLDPSDVKMGVLCLIAWLYYGRTAKMGTNYKSWLSPFKTYGYYGVR